MRAKLRDIRAGRTLFIVQGNGNPGFPGYASVSTVRVTSKPSKARHGLGWTFRYTENHAGRPIKFTGWAGDLGVRKDYHGSNGFHYNCNRVFTRRASADEYASRLRHGHVTWLEVPEPDPMDELDY